MNRIVGKLPLADGVTLFRIEAPEIARRRRAGQFVILRLDAEGERIPLTLVDSDPEAGSITLVVQAVGATTKRLAALREGEEIRDLAGPLGHPTPVRELGTVAVVAGGVGAAEALPVIKAWRGAGNRVPAIVGARSADLLILTEELRTAADELHLCTEDGSLGKRGLVTDLLRTMINDGAVPDLAYAIGPVPMMKAVADLTRPYGIPTLASLNPIMVDGTGMCGCCRVTVGGTVKFACVDGPDFDAHQVDFGELRQRQGAYREEEREAETAEREEDR
ncbi:MAG TPA: sulfide/dihydroorotate dehydrogenase-like FAD/NAD-binding protein [bacterium]|nr:sulfide/dihydroorotate dehydrogenase-like FAD/NAD-binding protein [bacterium]HPQ65255.1 sulfide/dihydroorotate dehydrogenase-like FAD/NAD-binding protein [bacterium]